ncbi:DUF262 domain-containing protein [Prodigiosinella aquatilis]|nr:DUF262 domain-containing protein [Prodigiosinella sp. LS101]WJV54463.1 DUF262 domain-containing protein [Prodigiosinella sp. LS101]WJV58825.1 DUF262 domain-containing protein [Pectobacteriaceae bacterium C111]
MARKKAEHTPKTKEEKELLDQSIVEMQKITDHEIREFPISVIVDKFQTGLADDEAELFIPDYQREFIWNNKQKSRFIESLLLNLPIPYIFVADIGSGENEGRLEIVDGSQRIRTLHQFTNNMLTLEGLQKLVTANGFKYSDFSSPRRLRFDRKTIRMIELTEYCDEETRREIFDRLNTGGKKLTTMEQRQGSNDGPFLAFVNEISEDALFQSICPLGDARKCRSEYPELALRYFAYTEEYLEFRKSVDEFLTTYLKRKNAEYTEKDAETLTTKFHQMCKFIETYFPNGFRKVKNATTVPRIRFEALAVGATLALEEDPNLVPQNIESWINSKEFITHTRSDASNSKPKVKARIEYVKNKLLGRDVVEEANEEDEDEADEME